MKTILSALVALSVIVGVDNTASALDAKTFYEQVDRNHYAKADWTAVGAHQRASPAFSAAAGLYPFSSVRLIEQADVRQLAACPRAQRDLLCSPRMLGDFGLPSWKARKAK